MGETLWLVIPWKSLSKGVQDWMVDTKGRLKFFDSLEDALYLN